MDKLENESWEEYVFRKDLFTLRYEVGSSYEDGCRNIIKEVVIPSEYEITMKELYKIRDKYRMCRYDLYDFTYTTQEDITHWRWLMDKKKELDKESELRAVVQKQEKLDRLDRYNELVTIISETHKEHLDELFEVISVDTISSIHRKQIDENHKKKTVKNIELYNKYMKNKELFTQINELEIKLNELKSKIIN